MYVSDAISLTEDVESCVNLIDDKTTDIENALYLIKQMY